MGLLSRIRNPVSGTAQVVGCTPVPTDAMRAPCRMQLVIHALGVAPFSCEQTVETWAGKWPSPGDTLPVTFDSDHPDRLRVEWDQIPDSVDQARLDADALAASLRAGAAVPGPPAPTVPTTITMAGGQPMVLGAANTEQVKAAIAKAEQKLGMDLDGDGTVAGATAGPGQQLDIGALMAQAQAAMTQLQRSGAIPGMPAAAAALGAPGAPAPKDTIAELERLGDLRDRGALTDAEFDAQKQRILGGGA
jgi:hypothetical protein